MSETNSGAQLTLSSPITDENRSEVLLVLGAEQHHSWQQGDPLFVEKLIQQYPAVGKDKSTVLALIANEIHCRRTRGSSPRLEEYLKRFPHFGSELRSCFDPSGLHSTQQHGPLVNTEVASDSDVDAAPPQHVGAADLLPDDVELDEIAGKKNVGEPNLDSDSALMMLDTNDGLVEKADVGAPVYHGDKTELADPAEQEAVSDSSIDFLDVEEQPGAGASGPVNESGHDNTVVGESDEPNLQFDVSQTLVDVERDHGLDDSSQASGQHGQDVHISDSSLSFLNVADLEAEEDTAQGDSKQQPEGWRTPSYSLSYLSLESLNVERSTDPGDSAEEGLSARATFQTADGTHAPSGTSTDFDISLPQATEEYEIIKEIGRGGMGIVYKAEQKSLKRIVALKMLLGEGATEYRIRRFQAEAEVIARLRHTNIVQIFDIGMLDGKPFFSLEFVSGGSLHQKINRTPQDTHVSVDLMVAMAEAMQVAHDAGIIHRDLKPGNVLMTDEGVPKITDFGLAKQFDNEDLSNTKTGAIMGTPSYMAPEQALGKVREMGPPVDIYALGAIFYEMMTGRPPFLAATLMDTLEQVRYEDPIPPSKLQPKTPKDLETICLKCLQKDPTKRYESSKSLAEDLKRYQHGVPILARATKPWERWAKWAKRNPATAALILLAFLVGTGTVSGVVWGIDKARRNANEAADKARKETIETSDKLAAEKEASAQLQQQARFNNQLNEARKKISDSDYLAARAALNALIRQIEGNKDFAGLLVQANDELAKVGRALASEAEKRAAKNALADIREKRNGKEGALFYSTLATGEDRADNLDKTETVAKDALRLAGVLPEDRKQSDLLKNGLSPEEHKEVLATSYEMLIILSDVEALRAADELEKKKPTSHDKHLQQALSYLDDAARLGKHAGHPTKAYYLRRRDYLTDLKRNADAGEENKKADALAADTPLDFYLLGDRAFKRKDMNEAVKQFEGCLGKDAKHFWAQYYLSVAYLRLKRFDAAQSRLSACLQLRDDFVWIYLLRAFASSQRGDYDAARDDFNKAQSLLDASAAPNPQQQFALLANRGLYYYQLGLTHQKEAERLALADNAQKAFEKKKEAALAFLNAENDLLKAIPLDETEFAPRLTLAQVYVRQSDLDEDNPRWDKAVMQLTAAIAQEKEFADLYRLRAGLHLDRKDGGRNFTAALNDVNQALKILNAKPLDDPDKDKVPPLYVLQGRILYKQGVDLPREGGNAATKERSEQFEKAIQSFDRAIVEANKIKMNLLDYVDAYLGMGDANLKLDRWRLAKDSYDKYLENGGKDRIEVFRGRAIARAQLHDDKGAIEDFSSALRLERSQGKKLLDAFVLTQRGLKYLAAGASDFALTDFQDAVKSLNQQLAASSDDPKKVEQINAKLIKAYNGLAQAYYKKKEFNGAESSLEAILAFRPKDPVTNYSLGQARLQLKVESKLIEAVANFDTVIEQNKEDAEAYLGRAYANAELSRARRNDPAQAKLHAQRASSDYNQAITYFKARLADPMIKPSDVQPFKSRIADAYVARSSLFVQQREYLAAAKEADQAAAYRPNDADLLCDAARVFAVLAVSSPSDQRVALARTIELLRRALGNVPREARRSFWQKQIAGDTTFDVLRDGAKLEYAALEKEISL